MQMVRGVMVGLGIIGGLTIVVSANQSINHASTAKTSSSSVQSTVRSKATVRTNVVRVKPQAYYVVLPTKSYQMHGSYQHLKLKPTHDLRQLRHVTWTVTAYTDVISPGGQFVRYNYAKSSTGVQGWIKATALKAGRHYQVSAAKRVKAQNAVVVAHLKKTPIPSGKVYQLKGNQQLMQWTKAQPLNRQQTYRVTKQRTYYQAGKAYRYDYVTSPNGTGWVWHGDLKPGHHFNVDQQQRAIKQQLQTYLQTVTKDGTAAVAFYNLSPSKNSLAAKAPHAAVYRTGQLAVASHGNQVKTAASTYKLYIIAYLMHLKQQGQFSWTSANQNGVYNTIVHSANDFPEQMMHQYGLAPLNAWCASQGFYPPFSQERSAATTANSLVKLLKDLETGQGAFTNQADRARILKLMGKQEFRAGIPAGAKAALKGTTVQDKVGFLADDNNDAAIVHLPNGQRYILVVMTSGHHQSGLSGFPRIAKITKRIQQIVY